MEQRETKKKGTRVCVCVCDSMEQIKSENSNDIILLHHKCTRHEAWLLCLCTTITQTLNETVARAHSSAVKCL
jgi:hypothetical protein